MTEEELYEEEVGQTEVLSSEAIYITGEICSDTVSPAVAFITSANITKENSKLILIIQSAGGALAEGFALASCIKASSIPVVTVAIGECDSSALIIAMSGHQRLVAKTCSVLSHQYSAGLGMSKYSDLIARQRDLEMMANRVVDHYVECTGLTSKDVRKKLVNDKDVFLSAEEAIGFGLFDDLFVSYDQLFEDEVVPEEVELIEEKEPA
jgi:ATP-dependent Clp protease protease subunit